MVKNTGKNKTGSGQAKKTGQQIVAEEVEKEKAIQKSKSKYSKAIEALKDK